MSFTGDFVKVQPRASSGAAVLRDTGTAETRATLLGNIRVIWKISVFDYWLSTGLIKALPRATRRPCSGIGDQAWLVESDRHTLPDGVCGGLSARHGRPGGGRPPQVTRNENESSRGAWCTMAATATGLGPVKETVCIA